MAVFLATPYGATFIVDFWRRWHITLSTILRDYLYISLGGNRLGAFRKYVNLMITMVLGGLWHGANWTFVVWGTLHGLFLVVAHLYRELAYPKLPLWLALMLTNLAVVFAWIFFRAENFAAAANLIQSFGLKWDTASAANFLTEFRRHMLLQTTTSYHSVASGLSFLALCYVVAATVRTQELLMWYQGLIGN